MMGAVAKSVVENGGNIIPVSTAAVWEMESSKKFENDLTGKIFDYTDKVVPIMAEDMSERKKMMREMGDACFVLPGSIGTFDELFEVLCLAYLKEYNKPCVILDVDNYWRGFKDLCETAIADKFALPMIRGLCTFVGSVEEMLPAAYAYYAERDKIAVNS